MSSIIVAVYGTLKEGHNNHRVMKSANGKFIGKDDVQVAQLKDVGFPCVKFSDNSDKWLEVELYEVEEDQVHKLDSLEGYREGATNNHYNRIIVTTLKDKEVSVYEYNHDISEEQNNLEAHFVREVPSPRFYSWDRV